MRKYGNNLANQLLMLMRQHNNNENKIQHKYANARNQVDKLWLHLHLQTAF